MAGAACKVIINMLIGGLVKALETILTNPSIHRDIIPNDERLKLIQRLADIDLHSYDEEPEFPSGGLAGIVVELQYHGLVTDEVWQILKRPVKATRNTRKEK